MTQLLLLTYAATRAAATLASARRLAGAVAPDRGEGVISAAIAVLVMAFLGAAMWVGFNAIWGDAEQNIGDQVEQIGS
jgi:hypothetical protein